MPSHFINQQTTINAASLVGGCARENIFSRVFNDAKTCCAITLHYMLFRNIVNQRLMVIAFIWAKHRAMLLTHRVFYIAFILELIYPCKRRFYILYFAVGGAITLTFFYGPFN